jgi:hypothetical protein
VREHDAENGTRGCGVLSRTVCVSGRDRDQCARACEGRTRTDRGSAVAAEVEDYAIYTHIASGANPSVRMGCDQTMF